MKTTTHKETTMTTTADLTTLRNSTEQDWDMAVDTAETPERRDRAAADRDSAMAAWDAAEEAIDGVQEGNPALAK